MRDSDLYSPEWFKKQKSGSTTSAQAVLPILFDLVGTPRSVIDVGCGVGPWLKAAIDLGATDVLGLDGDWIDKSQLQIPANSFKAIDINGTWEIGQAADVAICLEVGEHIEERSSADLVRKLTGCAPVVLFSAAIPHQPGTGHINGQWPEFWAALFEKNGFVAVDYLRRRVWTDPNVEYWYAQNMIVYARASDISKYPKLARELECGYGSSLPLVHPRRYYYALQPLPSIPTRAVRKIKHIARNLFRR